MDIQVEITWREEEREFYGGQRGRIIAAYQLGECVAREEEERERDATQILSAGNRCY